MNFSASVSVKGLLFGLLAMAIVYHPISDSYPNAILASAVNSAIAFSEYGFDFGNWGLIDISVVPFHFGMDFQWYPTLKEAFLDSWMSDETT